MNESSEVLKEVPSPSLEELLLSTGQENCGEEALDTQKGNQPSVNKAGKDQENVALQDNT